ncbi:galactose-binding domain-like protein [Massariosphaeria phaeospora]|uniref:allantoicase n=1 Tax=Massariosphaeria phaeospora TaxID=100035 RepID=A0A7C8IKL3_9PLEO|nr:galactose-binding domain-like protein [Massariosphaeria phaeospora]
MEIPILSPEEVSETATSKSASQARAIAIEQIESTFKSQYTDLVSAPLGSRILSFSDEWFASASNLITPTPPIRRPGVFTHAGAWYDGWETRRHNSEPADWVVIRLGVASGKVAGVEVDTAFFNGNHAPEIAVQGCFVAEESETEVMAAGYTGWEAILDIQECGPSQRHAWLLEELTEKAYTHVKLLMYPDGGIARFRLYGVAVPVFPQSMDQIFELSATVMGGVATSCSDQHFGTKDNLLLPGRGKDMGDGWETKRTRGEHVDWTIVRLGVTGEVDNIVIDTAHFRGNFPQKVQVFAGHFEQDPASDAAGWVEILQAQKSGPDKEHQYKSELKEVQGKRYTHAKLVIIPDGGVKRFRIFGRRV